MAYVCAFCTRDLPDNCMTVKSFGIDRVSGTRVNVCICRQCFLADKHMVQYYREQQEYMLWVGNERIVIHSPAGIEQVKERYEKTHGRHVRCIANQTQSETLNEFFYFDGRPYRGFTGTALEDRANG